MSNSVEIIWQNETFHLLPEKAIYWEREKTLFIADPHFGKSAAFRKHGIPVTEKTTEDDIYRLSRLIQETGSLRIVFLGDFIHAKQSKTQVLRNLLFLWREEFPSIDLHLIRGNHDLGAGDPWSELNIHCHDEPWTIFKWECRHHPNSNLSVPYFAGHLHPGYILKGKGRAQLRTACFQIGMGHIIFPAFGSFTGLKNIKPESGEQLFLTNGEKVIALPSSKSFLRKQ
ncbi:MAG: ligase-associated DNA damage response endonuclease PdeM [Opitutales bacterium]|nr:ligase-associated DNA damage response endonuclease PdeM [Opitutales bacterium]